MPRSSSIDQALATAPTSPSGGEKGGVSSGTASRMGGREGGLGGRQAAAVKSPSSPTSGTPFEDRSSPAATFDSSAAGRKRKKVYYGKKHELDSSSLSEADSSSSDESEGHSREEGDDNDNASDIQRGEPAQQRTLYNTSAESWSVTSLWSRVMNEALLQGLRLIPFLSTNTVVVGGKSLGRNGLLSEYVRRQSGVTVSCRQIHSRTQVLRKKGTDDLKSLLLGETRPYNLSQDWSAFLGPDLHPPSKPSKERSKSASTQQKKQAKRVKREPKTPSSSAFPTLTAPAGPTTLPSPYPSYPSTTYQPYSNPPYHPHFPPTHSVPQPPLLPPQLAQPSSSSPVLAAPSRHVPPQALPPTPLAPHDLSAFLSSFSPSHDFARASSALQAAGLISLEDLASLFAFEEWSFEAFLQQALSRLDEAERATVKVVLEQARGEAVRG